MGENVSLRPAEPDDFARLAGPIAALPVFAPYKFEAATLSQRWTQALADAATMQVAVCQGMPVGLSWYLPRGAFASGAYLRFLSVIPAAQGFGVGPKLLQAYEHACQNAPGGLFVLTSQHNSQGATFYRSHGYSQVGTLQDFAVAGVTELIFWKR
jgi:GNAT superfamily N-acetyltransferase